MFKIDANGDVLSRKTIEKNYFAIDEYFPYSESSSQTSDSGYIILAYVYNGSSRDVLIVKTDAEGNELWNNTFSNRDGYELYSVRPTSDGGYVLAGNTRNDNDRPDNAWLVKTDAKGNILWDRTYASLADRDHQTTNAWVVKLMLMAIYFGTEPMVNKKAMTATSLQEDTRTWCLADQDRCRRVWSRTFGGTAEDAPVWAFRSSRPGTMVTSSQVSSESLISSISAGRETPDLDSMCNL